MTHQQVLWKIDAAAAEAAELTIDAFGKKGAMPEPEWAWELLQDMEDPTVDGLPNGCPRQFKHDFRRHVRILQEAK